MSDYPEHDKLTAAAPQSQVIGEFMEWLTGPRDIVLAAYLTNSANPDRLVPINPPLNGLLAEYFGIDLVAMETEKRTMLRRLRAEQAEISAGRLT